MGTPGRAPGRPAGTTPEAVLDAATRRFLRGERVDLAGLSAELGVSRPTLYRWFGSRDDLIGSRKAGRMSLFITGTDTGVGKTHTAVQLLRLFARCGSQLRRNETDLLRRS